MVLFYFTLFHSALAIIALVAGLFATAALVGVAVRKFWTPLFLVTGVATTATGFMFPLPGITPAVAVGIISTLVYLAMLVARLRGFNGLWRKVYVGGVVANAYFLAFVAVAQAFTKIAALQALAPTLSEPPFAASQAIVLAIFVGLGLAALRGDRRAPVAVA
ncbi:hypothetical protein [Caulobacter sp. NIBR2454]|uniref:hypothetical protein n=1 Tax=Caulobacter sp. NIBR2454 TaxID=3015996 RepID=UPI0022B6FB00|nr:hypothetical protein [Caulobacter sp. NIBR2454]